MKIKATYHLKYINLTESSNSWLKAVRRSGEQTIIDELIAINPRFNLKIFRKKTARIEGTAILSAASILLLQLREIKLSWRERKRIGHSTFRERDENILFVGNEKGIDVFVFDNESVSRMHQFFGIGMFVPQLDAEVRNQLSALEEKEVLI